MTTPTRRSKLGLAINAALVALAFGLLGFVIWRNRVKIQGVFSRPLDLRLLALAELIFLIGLVSTFFRWYFLVRVIDPRFTLRASILLGFIGNVFNLVIPGAVGGDLIKAAYLVRMHIKKTQAVASMVIDRIVGLLGLFILASIAGAFAWPRASGDVARLIVAAWVATGLGVLVLALIFGQVLTRLFPQLGTGHSRLSLITSELKEMSTTYSRRLDVVSFCTLMSVGNHSLNVLAFYVVGKMLFPSMMTTLVDHFLMVPLTLFTMAVPLPFGALGLTEEVSDQLFMMVGHPSGSLAMIGFRVVMYGSGLIGACVYLAKLKEVRGLTAAAHHIEEELIEGDLREDQGDPE
ncbi:MAG: lysylphosphatidylglycerol synthase transmembrane domain-containing protein [Isosphaeraceae bacterium]